MLAKDAGEHNLATDYELCGDLRGAKHEANIKCAERSVHGIEAWHDG